MKILFIAVMLYGCGKSEYRISEAPSSENNPARFGVTNLKLEKKNLTYNLPKIPWPGDFWPTIRGGISFRWRTKGGDTTNKTYKDFFYKILTPNEIKNLSDKSINKLSPAEKYDLWQGRSDLTTDSSAMGYERNYLFEKVAQYDEDVPKWIGMCNGWSLASYFLSPPRKKVIMESPTGQNITFYPGDIKALATLVYNDYQDYIQVHRIGSRCDDEKFDPKVRSKDVDCRDINPMSFHVTLTQYFVNGGMLIADIDPGEEVWNNPVSGFSVKYGDVQNIPATYKFKAPNATQIIHVDATLSYITEVDPEERELTAQQIAEATIQEKMGYTLELDSSMNIVGGEWDAESFRPDFIWYTKDKPSEQNLPANFPISLEKLNILLKASQ